MEDFNEYLIQGEPEQSEKAKLWKVAIGLQKVDALIPSNYLIRTAKQNIEGEISINEVKQRLENYYEHQPIKSEETARTEEADKVSARITEILSEETFSLSPVEYVSIHQRLFQNIYPFAGKVRDYNISKKEWVLGGASVLYASANRLKEMLEYDLEQEKKFSYRGLSQQEMVKHIANFISYLWQIHIFGEGNTRTTAVFLIKYLRNLGFREIHNDVFAENAWYFRNALVRANYEDLPNGIFKTNDYLILFLSNLLFDENHKLRNRELHIDYPQK